MSFNIRFDNPKDTCDQSWNSRRAPIRRMFEEIQPDVIGMQEPRIGMLDSTYALLPAFEHFKIEADENISDPQTGNIVIFYRKARFEPLDSGYFWLSETPEEASVPWNSTDTHYRTALWMKLRDRDSGKEFYFCTTHFPYKKAPVDTEVRARCASLIVDRMKSLAGDDAVVFVTGDMNASYSATDPRRGSITPFFENMHSAREEAVFTNARSSFNGFGRVSPEIRGKNLDHIFYLGARALLFETVDYPGYGVRWISDHYPILCYFEL
ncbi:MAG: hypothetical protein HDS65_02555 [Bacteroidales bacterium]|nr:hypothetical protein [Bacteroidales bacterium]